MLVLIAYDVNTETSAGKRRLRQVAKVCVDFGQRVQNSLFECSVNEAQFRQIQHRLSELIDPKKDSLRFYNLGNNYRSRIEHVGAKPAYDAEGMLMV